MMKFRFVKKIAFFVVVSFSVALGISAIGFTISTYERTVKKSPVDSLEKKLAGLTSAIRMNQSRDNVILEIMNLAEKYNQTMPSSEQYQIANEIYEMAIKYDNLNVDLICATITHESASTWDPKIVSHKGAMGLMQIMPGTGKYLAQSENMRWSDPKHILFDPVKNIRLGCRYLSSLIEIYGVEGGLAAYNGGEKKAATWLANNKANGILWLETQKYVPAIMNLYRNLKIK